VVVALVGAGTAFGRDGSRPAVHVVAAQHAKSRIARPGLLALPSAYLGLSKDTIKAQLVAGKTLAEVANATPGKSAAGLVDYVVAASTAKLDAWVAAGKITQAKEGALLAKLRPKVTALVNATWTRHP
jgi:ribosomal protein L10